MKKFTKVIISVLVISAVVALSGCSQKESKNLTVATNAEFQPFEYMDNNKIVGIDVDIANEIGKEIGKTVEIKNMEFDSVIPAITTGKDDLGVAGLSKTPDRAKSVDFSIPYYTAQNVIIIKATNTEVNGKDSLKGKKIAVQKGTTGDDIATGLTGDGNVVRFSASTDAITDLKNGKADAVIIDSFPAQTFVKQNTDLKIVGEPFASEQYCMAVKKGNKSLLKKVNKAIKSMQDNGTMDNIVKKYQ